MDQKRVVMLFFMKLSLANRRFFLPPSIIKFLWRREIFYSDFNLNTLPEFIFHFRCVAKDQAELVCWPRSVLLHADFIFTRFHAHQAVDIFVNIKTVIKKVTNTLGGTAKTWHRAGHTRSNPSCSTQRETARSKNSKKKETNKFRYYCLSVSPQLILAKIYWRKPCYKKIMDQYIWVIYRKVLKLYFKNKL